MDANSNGNLETNERCVQFDGPFPVRTHVGRPQLLQAPIPADDSNESLIDNSPSRAPKKHISTNMDRDIPCNPPYNEAQSGRISP